MAKEPAAPAKYQEDVTYKVRLTRVVPYRGTTLLPRDDHEISGAALNAIVETEGADVLDAAQPV